YNLNNNRLVDYNHKITTVVFDPSFKDYRPTSCANWFTYCTYLTTFIGMTEYLNTDSVTDMNSMFEYCEKLKTLDLSGFNTENVENMNSMFYSCSNLETIYVGDKWIMNKNNRSQNMFQYCYQLCGENGTDYSPQKYNDYFYAKIDGEGTLKQGYFTAKGHTALRPYSVIENGVQTFRFDGQKPENAYNMRKTKPEWNVNDIYKIVFDTSFYKYKPQSLESWFEGYSNLTEIEGTEYLNTSKATTMVNMFKGCKNITVLDLSGFNTSGLTFGFCFKDKSEVQAALDDPNFSWPNSSPCFKGTFSGCSKLQTIYVGDYWKSSYFFSNTVKINDSTSTFYKCEQLIGGAGTKYKNGCDLFQIDEGESSPGYLTYKSPFDYTDSQGNTPYAVLKDSTLYLYFNNDKPSNAIGIRALDDNVCKLVTKIVLDKSFKNYKLKSCRGLFAFLNNVKTIEGINENLNTENVADFTGMFYNCSNLKYMDLSGLNTAKATNMSVMFYGCYNLPSVDLSGFNTANLKEIDEMFALCQNLKTIYVDSKWNVDNAYASDMFDRCEMLYGEKGTECVKGKESGKFARIDGGESNPGYLTLKGNKPYEASIDYNASQPYLVLKNGILTFYYDHNRPENSFRIPKWGNIGRSFYNDTITKVVFDKSFADYRPTSTEEWFRYLPYLTTIEGIENLNTSEVTNMDGMFLYCTNLTHIDLSHFNTKKVTCMNRMFYKCEKLKVLDLSSFNTTDELSMSQMFEECKNLKTIYINKEWNNTITQGKVTGKSFMFDNCLNLVGGKGTKYHKPKLGEDYARIDGGESAPGYFTEKK
ncbi:MAG: BspA family leucine-rich repeat surface protein, partial [Bacteroidales bacterium]|nr:BspA family leucine-rich repeat surface protein [Bacteroidales bacterium]